VECLKERLFGGPQVEAMKIVVLADSELLRVIWGVKDWAQLEIFPAGLVDSFCQIRDKRLKLIEIVDQRLAVIREGN
jgi:hypothetical protein